MLQPPTSLRYLVAVLVVLLLPACGGGDGASSPTPAAQPTDGQPTEHSSLLLQPMGALPSCGPPPRPGDVGEVEGLVVPEGTVLQQRDDAERLIQVMGYVPLTPVQTLAAYQQLPVDVLLREHEQSESELVYETGSHRAFVKAQVRCATGSSFVAVIAEIDDAEAVPTPAGTARPPG